DACGKQCANLGCKQECIASAPVVERFDAKLVPGQKEALPGGVPNAKCEYSAKAPDTLGSPKGVAFQDYFGIRSGAESLPLLFELAPKLLEIVDLTVESDPVSGIGIIHGLVAGRGDIDYCQAPVA